METTNSRHERSVVTARCSRDAPLLPQQVNFQHGPVALASFGRGIFSRFRPLGIHRRDGVQRTTCCKVVHCTRSLEWRNWQTHQTQNLALYKRREGSTPSSSTNSAGLHSSTYIFRSGSSGYAAVPCTAGTKTFCCCGARSP